MWIVLTMDSCWLYMRPGEAIREKWRILDGKGESDLDRKFRA
jgi:hypothetical protein